MISGAHLSTAGGLELAFDSGVKLGCDCLQIFVKSQRQWRAPALGEQQIVEFKAARKRTGLAPVVAHASYLINLASPVAAMRKRSVSAMVDELQRCEALGVDYLVVHPGAFTDSDLEIGMKRIAKALDDIHQGTVGFESRILLETTAGQGTAIGYQFDQISTILGSVSDASRLGVCLDTCHLFAAGYDFRTADGYAAVIDELDSTIGVSQVRCIHVNDSKRECGSRVDRHEHIGKGKIGKLGFTHLVNDRRFTNIPMILETPKGKDGRGSDLDKVNLKRLRALIAS